MLDLLEMLFQIIADFIGCRTAKILLPAISLGVLRVDAPDSEHRPFRWHGFKRIQNGTILVEADTASFIGVMFWIVTVIAVAILWR